MSKGTKFDTLRMTAHFRRKYEVVMRAQKRRHGTYKVSTYFAHDRNHGEFGR
jgi:hypothetical protein